MTQPNPIELVCQEVVELVTEYLSGTLPPEERARFEQHLGSCPPCTAYLAQMKTTLELAAELASADAPAASDISRELGDLFRRWHSRHQK